MEKALLQPFLLGRSLALALPQDGAPLPPPPPPALEEAAEKLPFRLVMHRVRRTLAAKKRNWLQAFAVADDTAVRPF